MLPAGRREDQARVQQQAQEHEQRTVALRAEWEAQRAQLEKRHAQDVEAVKQQFEANQVSYAVKLCSCRGAPAGCLAEKASGKGSCLSSFRIRLHNNAPG
jgi:hypothetical protein